VAVVREVGVAPVPIKRGRQQRGRQRAVGAGVAVSGFVGDGEGEAAGDADGHGGRGERRGRGRAERRPIPHHGRRARGAGGDDGQVSGAGGEEPGAVGGGGGGGARGAPRGVVVAAARAKRRPTPPFRQHVLLDFRPQQRVQRGQGDKAGADANEAGGRGDGGVEIRGRDVGERRRKRDGRDQPPRQRRDRGRRPRGRVHGAGDGEGGGGGEVERGREAEGAFTGWGGGWAAGEKGARRVCTSVVAACPVVGWRAFRKTADHPKHGHTLATRAQDRRLAHAPGKSEVRTRLRSGGGAAVAAPINATAASSSRAARDTTERMPLARTFTGPTGTGPGAGRGGVAGRGASRGAAARQPARSGREGDPRMTVGGRRAAAEGVARQGGLCGRRHARAITLWRGARRVPPVSGVTLDRMRRAVCRIAAATAPAAIPQLARAVGGVPEGARVFDR